MAQNYPEIVTFRSYRGNTNIYVCYGLIVDSLDYHFLKCLKYIHNHLHE